MAEYPYLNPALSPEERAKDLCSRMSLQQKVRQLSGVMVAGEPKPELFTDGIGEAVIFAGPLSARDTAAMVRAIQDICMAQTEFRIPALLHSEALSGPMISDCLVFPTSIGLAASFQPELAGDMADRIRQQMLNLGIRQALSPVLDIIRDFRWGRTSEDFGSDPTLASAFGTAYVKGLQGEDLREGVAATAKHYLGYSMTEGGLNGTRTLTDWRDLRENFARPFEAAIRKAGLRSVMNSYSEYDGEPISSSKRLLTDLLRDDLGFDGIVVSDYTSINNLFYKNKTAESLRDAGVQCLKAGLDMELPNPDCYGQNLVDAVRDGELDETVIDRSVLRVLKLKFELGLFEKPYGEFEEMDNTEHDRKAAEAAEKLLTLTKNEGLLPLRDRNAKIAVIGPIGNNLLMLNGSYSYPAAYEMFLALFSTGMSGMEGVTLAVDQAESAAPSVNYTEMVDAEIRRQHPGAKTVFEALSEIYPHIRYVQGCAAVNPLDTGFEAAEKAAKEADVVVLCLGGKIGMMTECSAGESRDNVDITLPGRQSELLQRVCAANPRVILVHTDNKPLVDSFAYAHVPAILEGWLPGVFGGNAIAKAICGEYSPGGRLPVDVPKHVGQTPVYYYQHNGCRSDAGMHSINPDGYGIVGCKAQLPFGHGLSYTQFAYADGAMSAFEEDGIPGVEISATVTNTGTCDGDEVVQLYGVDEFASTIRPQKELLGFARLCLKAGESRRVPLRVRLDQMAFPNAEGSWVVEKGDFRFYLGKNANEPIFEASYRQPETLVIDHTKRGFFAEAAII